ncbi:hypothetical protein B0H19DRAFT_1082271, partial [Mycena capillaripes]
RHYPRTHSRSGSPPWAGASHDYRARAHSRSRSPPGAGASDHYRPRHSRSRSPARAGSSRQYAGKYRGYSRGANSPPRARSPPRAPKSPRQHEPWPRNDDARQWDDVPPYPRPNGRVESSRPTPAVLPRIDLSRVDAVAARVGAARHDDRAQGEQRGPKRKVPHDEGLESDRDSKRHRGTEEAPPLLKCRIIVNDRRGGGLFGHAFAGGGQTHPSRRLHVRPQSGKTCLEAAPGQSGPGSRHRGGPHTLPTL